MWSCWMWKIWQKENHMPKSANVILLGAAAPFLKILDAEVLRESVGRIFASKGEEVVQMNYRASI